MNLDELLRDEITKLAESVHVNDLTPEPVLRRATKVRRSRIRYTAIGVAAAVAVATGIGVAVVPHHSSQTLPPSIEPHTPKSFSISVFPQDADLTYDGKPGIAFHLDGKAVQPDGTTTPLFITDAAPETFAYAPATGSWVTGYPGQVVTSVDGSTITTIDGGEHKGFQLHTWTTTGEKTVPITTPGHDFGEILLAGILPDGTGIANALADNGQSQTIAIAPDGQATVVLGITDVMAVSPTGAMLGVTPWSGTVPNAANKNASYSCVDLEPWTIVQTQVESSKNGVRMHGPDDVVWCPPPGFLLPNSGEVNFNADGTRLAITESRASNPDATGSTESLNVTTIYNAATLAPLTTYSVPGGVIDRGQWDGDRYLAPVWQPGEIACRDTVSNSTGASCVGGDVWALAWLGDDGYQIGHDSQRQSTTPADASPWVFAAGPVAAQH